MLICNTDEECKISWFDVREDDGAFTFRKRLFENRAEVFGAFCQNVLVDHERFVFGNQVDGLVLTTVWSSYQQEDSRSCGSLMRRRTQ